MVVFGLMFQMPVVMVFLMRVGVVEPATFRRWRKAAIVGAFFFGMILTPPDVMSQIVLASCLVLLYEVAILIGSRVARPRKGDR
jgi:sec-independent protein translocase protein TatC